MPRTILTDNVIEKLCPEYQPLALPNAYFDNVGGAVKSKGIKPVPKECLHVQQEYSIYPKVREYL